MDTRKVQILQTGNEKALCLMNEDTTGDVAAFYKEQSERHVQTIVDRANAFPALVEALRLMVEEEEQQADGMPSFHARSARNLLDNLTR